MVIYSIVLCVKCFKLKMLNLTGPNALLFVQLLIALISRSTVNLCVISIGFLLFSLVTNWVSFKESAQR